MVQAASQVQSPELKTPVLGEKKLLARIWSNYNSQY
jgi:hypothetical protein